MLNIGATSHITLLTDNVFETEERTKSITLAKGSKMSATNIGSRQICFQTNNDKKRVKLSDIFVVPDAALIFFYSSTGNEKFCRSLHAQIRSYAFPSQQ